MGEEGDAIILVGVVILERIAPYIQEEVLNIYTHIASHNRLGPVSYTHLTLPTKRIV